MKHQFLPSSQRLPQCLRQSHRAWLLALGLALAPCLSAPVWAENFNLESVDFANNDEGMRIILHTGSIVPVQKVLISDNKLVLDIDQVNSGETVRTNFTGASNVSHVIVQPLNEHKIRMIIRGEGLSAPVVAFYGAGSGNSGLSAEESARLAAETSAALHRQQEAGIQSAVNNHNVATAHESAAVDHSALKDDDAPLAFGGFVDDRAGQRSHTSHGQDIKPSETGPLALHSQEPAPVAGNDFLGMLTSSKLGNYIPYGLLAMVVLGAGVFVRHKLTQLNPGQTEYEDFIEDQPSGKRASFREMADAYRSKHEDKRADNNPRRAAGKDNMIGLRGLNQPALDDMNGEALIPKSAPIIDEPVAPNTLEQILAAMQAANKPKKPMGVPAPKKQAINQYAQAQSPKQKLPKARQSADEAMLQEMKRAQMAQRELQQQGRAQAPANNPQANNPGAAPVNRATAAKKAIKSPNFQTIPPGTAINAKAPARPTTKSPIQPAKAAPVNTAAPKSGYASGMPKPATAAPNQAKDLTGNPEVLNFLRNVANLMEKDGKAEIAKSIHKNLSARNVH